jgi:hypothetical protein
MDFGFKRSMGGKGLSEQKPVCIWTLENPTHYDPEGGGGIYL